MVEWKESKRVDVDLDNLITNPTRCFFCYYKAKFVVNHIPVCGMHLFSVVDKETKEGNIQFCIKRLN